MRTTGCQAETAGLEFETDYRPADFWRLFFSASLHGSEVTKNPTDPEFVGNRIARASEKQASVGITYDNPGILYALIRGRYVGDRYDDAENEDYIPSYYLVDLSLSRSIGQNWGVFAGVENLLDETFAIRISSAGTVIGAPRLYHLGLRFGK